MESMTPLQMEWVSSELTPKFQKLWVFMLLVLSNIFQVGEEFVDRLSSSFEE